MGSVQHNFVDKIDSSLKLGPNL